MTHLLARFGLLEVARNVRRRDVGLPATGNGPGVGACEGRIGLGVVGGLGRRNEGNGKIGERLVIVPETLSMDLVP